MTHDDLNSLAPPAMLFALEKDRHGFCTETVTRALIRNAKNLRSDIRYRMAEDIAKALNADEEKRLDWYSWEKVVKTFSEITNK